jgi:hypothetical protein
MKKFLAFAVLATAATTLHASTIASSNIFYSAYVGCSNSCATVTLSWAAEPFPISYAEVDDSFGDFLFNLNVPFAASTGSISPDPQTVSGLSHSIIYDVTNGQVGVAVASIEPAGNGTLAKLDLLDSEMDVVDSTPFVASPAASGVPEPAAWTLAGAGLAFLFIRARAQRRKSRA